MAEVVKNQKFNVGIAQIKDANDGQMVIILAKPIAGINAIKINATNEARMLRSEGIANRFILKHLTKLANGTARVTGTFNEHKAGQSWNNADRFPLGSPNYREGIYEKDGVTILADAIDLGPIVSVKLGEEAVRVAMTAGMTQEPVAPKAPVAATPAAAEPVAADANGEQPM